MMIRRLGLFRTLCRVSSEVVTERGGVVLLTERDGGGGGDVEVAVEELDTTLFMNSV